MFAEAGFEATISLVVKLANFGTKVSYIIKIVYSKYLWDFLGDQHFQKQK